MLTPEQIEALRDAARKVADPITEYLIRDIAERITEAGQLTSTAAYEVWRAQQLGMSQREIKKQLKKRIRISNRELRRLLTQSAEVGYNFDIKNLPQVQAVPFAQNDTMQQIVSAAVALAQDDFTNITQTLGMVDPFGNALPLQDAYRSCMDFAFKQVSTGAADYNTAIRRATRLLADKGVQTIDYKSGVHTSLEAAVRRSVMGGLGLMQEQITQANHDELGADGWEISAHAASAPDHEPIQGKQYSDAEYQALNNSMVRRIGTLNCGHAAFPIILGVSQPQYTLEELEKFRADNAAGIDYQGRHYTMYEATQLQRRVEASMRIQKRRIITDEATGDKEKLQTDQIRYVRLEEEYKRFSKAADLRTQQERAEVAGFGPGQEKRAAAAEKQQAAVAVQEETLYNQKREEVRKLIRSDAIPKKLNVGAQNKHIRGSKVYIQGRSYIYGDLKAAQELVDKYHGTGDIRFNDSGEWIKKEFFTLDEDIGVDVNPETGIETPTNRFSIRYGKKGTHVVPAKRSEAK